MLTYQHANCVVESDALEVNTLIRASNTTEVAYARNLDEFAEEDHFCASLVAILVVCLTSNTRELVGSSSLEADVLWRSGRSSDG
jgi:hypothetical protein